jgi:hypothetical protein
MNFVDRTRRKEHQDSGCGSSIISSLALSKGENLLTRLITLIDRNSLLSAQRGVASNRILGGQAAVSVVCFVWRDVDVASGS